MTPSPTSSGIGNETGDSRVASASFGQEPSSVGAAVLVEELRAEAPRLERALRVPEGLTLDESNLMRRTADALEAMARDLAEARAILAKQYGVKAGRAVCLVSADGERVTDIYDIPAERMPHGYDYAAELDAAERERDEAMAALREKEEALVRAERKLAAYVGVCMGDKELTQTVLPMVRRALSTQNIGKNVSEDGQPVSASREQRGNEEG